MSASCEVRTIDPHPQCYSYLIENEPGYEGAFAMDEIRVVNGKRQGRIYPTIKFDREEKDIFILTIKSVDARGSKLANTHRARQLGSLGYLFSRTGQGYFCICHVKCQVYFCSTALTPSLLKYSKLT